jgi:hypothetical protein
LLDPRAFGGLLVGGPLQDPLCQSRLDFELGTCLEGLDEGRQASVDSLPDRANLALDQDQLLLVLPSRKFGGILGLVSRLFRLLGGNRRSLVLLGGLAAVAVAEERQVCRTDRSGECADGREDT